MPNPSKQPRPSAFTNVQLRKLLDAKLKGSFGRMRLTGKYCGGAWPKFTVSRSAAASTTTPMGKKVTYERWKTPYLPAVEPPPYEYLSRTFTNPFSHPVTCTIVGYVDDDLFVSKTGRFARSGVGPPAGGGPVNVAFSLGSSESFQLDLWDGVGGNYWVDVTVYYF